MTVFVLRPCVVSLPARERHYTALNREASGWLELEGGWEAGKSTGSAALELSTNVAEERSRR